MNTDYRSAYYRDALRLAFDAARRKQAKLYGKKVTTFDQSVGKIVLDCALAAMYDVATGGASGISMRTVTLGTGAGKSTSAWATISAAYRADQEFSCAYIVPTVKAALKAKHELETLLGKGKCVVWFRPTEDTAKLPEMKYMAEGDHIARTDLRHFRIVIVTHKLWKDEGQSGGDFGVTFYKGRRRNVIFIDECPEIVTAVSAGPSEVQNLLDELVRREAQPEWRAVLAKVVTRMNAVAEAKLGQAFTKQTLLTPEDATVFKDVEKTYLKTLTDEALAEDIRGARADELVNLLVFLQCAAKGCAFYSKVNRTFYAYRPVFELGPGHVLLDATADLVQLVTLNDATETVAVPQIDYSRLDVRHVKHPKQFRNIKKATSNKQTAEPYAEWMKAAVLANTQTGDNVLLVTHKAMLDHGYIPSAPDPENPMDWDGRTVNTIHWGPLHAGTNDFRHKSHVFCFAEFHKPRSKTISEVHAMSGTALSNAVLKDAQGRKVTAEEYAPRGIYAGPFEGHLLGALKQMAMRGAARNVDQDGRAAPMTLLTTMDLSRLSPNLSRMFPGVPPMKAGREPEGWTGGVKRETAVITAKVSYVLQSGGLAALVALVSNPVKAAMGADEVERLTGIRPDQLGRAFKSKAAQAAAAAYDCRLVAAKDLGKAGRMRHLVWDRLLAPQLARTTTIGSLLRVG